jgi:hypothetical protein
VPPSPGGSAARQRPPDDHLQNARMQLRGRFWASAPGKMTGPVVDQAAAHPIVEDTSLQDHADVVAMDWGTINYGEYAVYRAHPGLVPLAR